jgi:endonuclease/exonuclease/phosphatase family metal-dependent hydrolase
MKRLARVATLLAFVACRPFTNYARLDGPRYAANPLPTPGELAVPATASSLRVVTYNVKWGEHVDRAIAVLRSRAPLPGADIIALQEMDPDATRRIADALGMAYVYYPAGVHPKTHREFGNAILTRWPIVADQKLMLPHLGRARKSRRIATAATVRVGTLDIRVYSAHLGTQADIGPGRRRDQARTILADAAAYPLAIVAGDMNSHGIGNEFLADGFLWPTEHNGFTTALWNWDHIFLKGFTSPVPARASTGIVRDTLGTSDHDPVWAVALIALVAR